MNLNILFKIVCTLDIEYIKQNFHDSFLYKQFQILVKEEFKFTKCLN